MHRPLTAQDNSRFSDLMQYIPDQVPVNYSGSPAWFVSMLASDNAKEQVSGKTTYRFSDQFKAILVGLCDVICEIMGKPVFKRDASIKNLLSIFLFCHHFSHARPWTKTTPRVQYYLFNRSRDILETFVSLKRSGGSAGFAQLGYPAVAYLYSSLHMFYSTCMMGTIDSEVEKSSREKCESLVRDCAEVVRDLVAGRVVMQNEAESESNVKNLITATQHIVNVCMRLSNREVINEIDAHKLVLALLRSSGLTTGRYFNPMFNVGLYEDTTARNYARLFLDLADMLELGLFTANGLPTDHRGFNYALARTSDRIDLLDPVVIFHFCDSVSFHLDALFGVGSLISLKIAYQSLQPPEWNKEGLFDDRIFMDCIEPALSLALEQSQLASTLQARQEEEVVAQWNTDAYFVTVI